MAKPSGANVTITKHSMADSVFRHAYGGEAGVKAPPVIAVPSGPTSQPTLPVKRLPTTPPSFRPRR